MTLEQVRETLHQLAADVNSNHYRIGQLYNYVVEKKLAATGGFKSAQEFFSQQVKELSQTVLSLCGTVARAFTAEACTRYGTYHLHALLTYAKAAKLQLSREEPGPTPIDVPKEDGAVEQKPFSRCTVEEVRAAVRHKRAKDAPGLPEQDLALIQALRDSVTANFPEEASHTRFTARVIEDKTYITLRDVLVDDLELLTETLLDNLNTPRIAA
jgi:hypothetical protein